MATDSPVLVGQKETSILGFDWRIGHVKCGTSV